jgi:hypothetical protein
MPADLDPALAGVLLWTGLALAAGILLRRAPATLLVWVAAGWALYYLKASPYAAGTVLLALGLWVVHRWGLRHLLLYGGLALVFAAVAWVNVAAGMLLPAALGDATGRTVRVVALVAAAFVAWRVVTGRLGYLTNPLAWSAETRRVQQTAEHRRAMGLGRRGLGWITRHGQRAVTGRPPPALPRPPDDIDRMLVRDLAIHARRAGLKPSEHTTSELRAAVRAHRAAPTQPAPPTASDAAREPEPATVRPRTTPPPEPDDFGIPEPLFRDREPVWRWR